MTTVTQPDETNSNESGFSNDVDNTVPFVLRDRKPPEEFPNYLGNGKYASISGDVVAGDTNQCI